MRPGDREQVPTVSAAVRDAAAICDPDGIDTVVTSLYEGFEDDERPATASEDLAAELLGTVREIDPAGDSPAARLTAATATWLALNPGDEDPDHALVEGARLVFGDELPAGAEQWLAERGLEA